MQCKRGELIPVGKIIGGLDGPVAAIREASPQALHHFTRFDQVNQLVSASEADPEIGFMARMLVLCSLPRTNPGNRLQYKRVNGPYKLIMIAGGDCKLPFGNLPRLLLAWVSTEAVRTQNRELVLGKSLAEFMRALGIYNSGGKPQTRLRNQMDRLFHASVQLIYEDEGNKGIRQIGAILHAKAVSATVVKPFGFATGDWEGSRCGIRTRIALQNHVAQVVVAITMGSRAFCDTRTGGMLIGYARVSTQETREESPEKRRRTPLTTFWAAETQLGTHSLCQEPSETGTLSLSTLVRNAPLSVQNRTNLPDTLSSLVPRSRR